MLSVSENICTSIGKQLQHLHKVSNFFASYENDFSDVI